MEHARATWTDQRLDDLARRTESGLARIDEDLRTQLQRTDRQAQDLGARIDAQGQELGMRIDAQGQELGMRIDAQGQELGMRIDALQRTMLQIGAVTGGGIIATLASVLITRV